MKLKLMFCAAVLTFITTLNAFAFNNERKGFILGIGAGIHRVDANFDNDDNAEYSLDPGIGLATSLKIGGGITNQFALYYVRNASWFKDKMKAKVEFSDQVYNYTDDSKTYATGISGIGATYYFKPEAPSGYILGAIGLGDIDTPFEDDSNAQSGSAFMVGGGYEFSPHVLIEGTYLRANIDDDIELNTNAFQVTINYIWY